MQRMRMEEPMTTLDKRIPYYPVLMVLTQPPVITDIPLAQGYSFHPYESSYKEAWIALHVSLGQLDRRNLRSSTKGASAEYDSGG